VTMLQAARFGFWTPVETCNFSLLRNVQTGCGTTQPLIQRNGILRWGYSGRDVELTILLHLVAKVKNEWRCTSAPPLCLHAMNKKTFLNTGFHNGRL